MRAAAVAFVFLVSTGIAAASGGLHYSTDDKAVAFELEGGVTRGMGSPLFSFRGELDIKDHAVADDLRKTSLGREHVAQYWLGGEDLKLLLYREREGDKAHGYVELLIETAARGEADEGLYEGRYALSVFDTQGDAGEGMTFDVAGDVVCSAE